MKYIVTYTGRYTRAVVVDAKNKKEAIEKWKEGDSEEHDETIYEMNLTPISVTLEDDT
jgi:hypothetical protein